MLRKKLLIQMGVFSKLAIPSLHAKEAQDLYLNTRSPLLANHYMELPIGAVRPEGWLKDQMQRMCDGMTGNLDVLYEKVMGPRNGWLGGDGDVWERGP